MCVPISALMPCIVGCTASLSVMLHTIPTAQLMQSKDSEYMPMCRSIAIIMSPPMMSAAMEGTVALLDSALLLLRIDCYC
jgi:hypothetical protein